MGGLVSIFLLIAVILFLVAAIGSLGKVNAGWLGMAFFAGAFLVESGVVG